MNVEIGTEAARFFFSFGIVSLQCRTICGMKILIKLLRYATRLKKGKLKKGFVQSDR
jgi:hypothetical protein